MTGKVVLGLTVTQDEQSICAEVKELGLNYSLRSTHQDCDLREMVIKMINRLVYCYCILLIGFLDSTGDTSGKTPELLNLARRINENGFVLKEEPCDTKSG